MLFSWLSFLQEELLSFLGLEAVININDLCDEENNTEVTEDNQASSQEKQDTVGESQEKLIGIVKKWKQFDEANGHGYIRDRDGREWGFHSKDCVIFSSQHNDGSVMFKKGDKVSYNNGGLVNKKTGGVLKAVNVELYQENSTTTSPDKCDIEGSVQKLRIEENSSSSEADKPVPVVVTSRKPSKQKLLTLLREYDQSKKEELFSVSLQSCDICYSDKVRFNN